MAQELNDGEFWLPSEFLTDDDLLTDFKTNGFGFNSDLSSPVESVIGSNETESDEDDFITGLTRQMANTAFLDSSFSNEYNTKGQKLSSSPQSTLYGCKAESIRSSPNSVSSPPDVNDKVGWNFLYAAAEEAARQRIIEENSVFYSNSLYGPTTHKINQVKSPNQFYQNQIQAQAQAQARLSYQQLQFQLMKQQEKIGYQFQNGRRNVGVTTAWPTLQQSQQMQPSRQRTGTGMRAVFLGETGARKERTGTGVFLPRRFDSSNQTTVQKKPGCSVLLPEKVVHALNLNLDSIDSSSHTKEYTSVAADCAVGIHHQINVKVGQQMQNFRPQQQQLVKQELGLPQEWTY